MANAPQIAPTIPEEQAIYVRNLTHLWRQDPALARRIDAIPDDARIPVQPAKSGGWTVAVEDAANRKVYLHSRYRPEEEASKLIDSVEIDEQYCFIVHGFGLGYHLLALRQRIPEEAIIVVAEPNLRLLAAALAHVDLTDILANGRLIILPANDKTHLHEKLQPHTALLMMGAKYVSHPPSERIAPDFHRAFRTLVTDFVSYSRMTLVTLVSNAFITCKNIANNIAAYVTCPPIDGLRDRFAGYPAIIVSAGPSLRKNIDQLERARGRAVICAVQTTLTTLVDRGITPDFVTSLDYHEISRQYFEGVKGIENVHLVAEPKATWHVIDTHPGPISLLDNAFGRLLVGDKLGARDGLPAGATVAHLAFYLARYMGCDPIIFVGQDLAYTGHVYYTPGVEIHRAWRSEINRFNTLETKEWERTVRQRPILRKTVDNEGEPIYTDELLFTYLEQFERDIAGTSARVLNATEGGARIAGAEPVTLAETIDRWCTREIPPEKFAYRDQLKRRDTTKLPTVRKELTQRLDEVQKMGTICKEMLTLLKRLKKLTHDPPAFNKLLVRVDELRRQVDQAQRPYRIINAASQLAELRRFSADRRLTAQKAEGVKRAKQQLTRDIEFVTGIHTGSEQVHKMLTEALERVEQELKENDGQTSI